MKKFVVWDVERARPVTEPLFYYGQAASIADLKEGRTRRAFIIVEA